MSTDQPTTGGLNVASILGITDILVPLVGLAAKFVERANQIGALTEKQRQELADGAEVIFAAAASVPPPPPPKES